MKTTIYLYIEEQIDDSLYAFAYFPQHKATPARVAFAESLKLPLRDGEVFALGLPVGNDLGTFEARINRIGESKGFSVTKVKPTTWKLTQTVKAERASYEFPTGSFAGCDQTKWGPTDFYDPDRATMAQAFASGLDFETPWLSCKKEILSSQITRSKGIVSVTVSVSDDFDTNGTGESSFRVTKATTEEQFFDKLGKAGDEAWNAADEDRQGNQSYLGYSVGPVDAEGNSPWVCTYIVNLMGFDTPPGDNYHRWGWQEVEDDEDPTATPDDIPKEVAAELERQINEDFPKVAEFGGFRARQWK
jgi:hypothetical protein